MAIFGFALYKLKQQLRRICLHGMLTLFTVALPFGAYSADPSAPNHLTVKGQVKLNEITPDEENHNREVGRKLTKKYLNGYEDASLWHRINSMDWDLLDDEFEKTKI